MRALIVKVVTCEWFIRMEFDRIHNTKKYYIQVLQQIFWIDSCGMLQNSYIIYNVVVSFFLEGHEN